MVPASVMRETIEAIQAGHAAALVAVLEQHQEALASAQNQVEQVRHDMAEAIASERAETARRLADRDTLHLDTLGRLLAQAAIERSLWLERVDAAEVRAERVEQRLDQVMDVLLSERRPRVEPEVDHERVPWWRRWLGVSKRSDIG
jgi:hypothetical protein